MFHERPSMSESVHYEDVLAAQAIVYQYLPRTTNYEYASLSRMLGCQFWIKHENHLPVGAFKVRGGVHLVHSLTDEGLATREPAGMTLDIMRRLVDDIVLVSDAEIEQGIRLLLSCTHNLAEGAGAATTAAALKIRAKLRDQKVVAVLSGGNLDLRMLRGILAADSQAAAGSEPA